MGVLVLDYGLESSFKSSIKNAKSALNKRVDDYENIENRARSISSNTDNCANCAYYVKKKYQQIQGKIDKLNTLSRKVEDFVDTVRETDKRVASRIKKDTKSFKKRTGIGKSSKSLWSSLCEGIGDLFTGIGEWVSEKWNGLKQWYEDNKYWINIVVDVVLVVVAVAACIGTSGLALAVGIFFVADAVFDLAYDVAAGYQYYVEGNEAEAERLAGKGGRDAFMYVGRKADNFFGTDFFEGALGVVYTGLSICAIGYSFYKAGKQMLKDLKLNKIKVKSLFNGNRNKIKWSSHFNKDNLIKAIRHQLKFNKVQQKDVVKLGYKLNKLGINLKSGMELAKSIQTIRNLGKGIKKTYKVGKKYYEMIREGNYNPFEKTTKALKEFYNGIVAIPSGGVQ